MCALADNSTKSSVVLDHELDPREEPRSFKNHDMKVTALVTETQDCRYSALTRARISLQLRLGRS
jgi:hypothetical protein